MPGQKVKIKVDKDNIKMENKDSSLFLLHSAYDYLMKPPENAYQLSRDINRTPVFFQTKEGGAIEKTDEIRASQISPELNKRTDFLAQLLGVEPEKVNQLQGMGQTMGNTSFGIMRANTALNINGTLQECMLAKGREWQSIVKINDNEFRTDYTVVQYGFVNMEGQAFIKDTNGKMVECPMEAINTIEYKNGDQATARWLDNSIDPPQEISVECMPLMKIDGSLTVKFDENNEKQVTVDFQLETFTPDLQYTGPKDSPEMVSLVEKDNKAQEGMVPTLENFKGLNTKETNESLRSMLNMVSKGSANDAKLMFKSRVEDFRKLDNKKPMLEMNLYADFFANIKEKNKPATFSLKNILTVGGEKELKQRTLDHITKWEPLIMSSSDKERPYLMSQMQRDLAELKPKTLFQRLFEPKQEIKLNLDKNMLTPKAVKPPLQKEPEPDWDAITTRPHRGPAQYVDEATKARLAKVNRDYNAAMDSSESASGESPILHANDQQKKKKRVTFADEPEVLVDKKNEKLPETQIKPDVEPDWENINTRPHSKPKR